jgi:hypothetical protein
MQENPFMCTLQLLAQLAEKTPADVPGVLALSSAGDARVTSHKKKLLSKFVSDNASDIVRLLARVRATGDDTDTFGNYVDDERLVTAYSDSLPLGYRPMPVCWWYVCKF